MQTKEVLLSGDFRYAYRRFGDPEAPAIILLMGLGMSMDAWPESLISGLLVQRFTSNAIKYAIMRGFHKEPSHASWSPRC